MIKKIIFRVFCDFIFIVKNMNNTFIDWYQKNTKLFALKFEDEDELIYIPPNILYSLGDCPLTKFFDGDINKDGVVCKNMKNKILVFDIFEFITSRIDFTELMKNNMYEVLIFDDMYLNSKILKTNKHHLMDDYLKFKTKYHITIDKAMIIKFISEQNKYNIKPEFKEMFPYIFGIGTQEEENNKQLKYLMSDEVSEGCIRIPNIFKMCFGLDLTTEQLIKYGKTIADNIYKNRRVEKIQFKHFKINKYIKEDFPILYIVCFNIIIQNNLYKSLNNIPGIDVQPELLILYAKYLCNNNITPSKKELFNFISETDPNNFKLEHESIIDMGYKFYKKNLQYLSWDKNLYLYNKY